MNYYKEQLEKIHVKEEGFSPKVKVYANGSGEDTNFLDLNKESAAILIEWLQENFISRT